MQVHVYWNHAPGSVGADGICWVEAEGPPGSVAVGGGGYGSYNDPNTPYANQSADPQFPIVASVPHPQSSRAWRLGVAAPRNSSGAVTGHVFVVVLEGL